MDDESSKETIKRVEEPKKKMQRIVQQMAELFMTEEDFFDQTDAAAEDEVPTE